MGPDAELDSARRRLAHAYQQARAVGYRTDSAQMHALAAAERTYQQARSKHDRTRAADPDLPGPDAPDPGLDRTECPHKGLAGTADMIDLRDAGHGRDNGAAAGRRGDGTRQPPPGR